MKNVEDIYPLSPMQENLLLHVLAHPDSEIGFEQSTCVLRGLLDVTAFERAWQRVVDRHPVLRTLFLTKNVERPLQVVRQQVRFTVTVQDWSDLPAESLPRRLQEHLAADRERGFDLIHPPLLRVALFRLAPDLHRFVWSYHHLVLDGWCRAILLQEILALYDGFAREEEPYLPPAPRFREYLAWIERRNREEGERFWRHLLSGLDGVSLLPIDRPTGRRPVEGADLFEEEQLSSAATRDLQDFARRHGLTLSTLVHGAWALLLSRYNGERDVVFGTTVSGRPADLPGAEAMLGMFINNLPVRVRARPEDRLLSWLQEVQDLLAELRHHEHVSPTLLQEWSGVPAGQRLFDTLLLFQNYPVGETGRELSSRKLSVEDYDFRLETSYPITLLVGPAQGYLLRIYYQAGRFEPILVRRMVGHLRVLLEAMPGCEGASLSQIPLLARREEDELLRGWSAAVQIAAGPGLHSRIRERAERAPALAAVSTKAGDLSWAELDRRSQSFTHWARELGIGPEAVVAVRLSAPEEQAVALLGLLGAGCACAFLGDADLGEGLRTMGATILLTDRTPPADSATVRVRVLAMPPDPGDREPPSSDPLAPSPDGLALVSGCGLAFPYRALARIAGLAGQLGLGEDGILLAQEPSRLDALPLVLSLAAGARLVMGEVEGLGASPGSFAWLSDPGGPLAPGVRPLLCGGPLARGAAAELGAGVRWLPEIGTGLLPFALVVDPEDGTLGPEDLLPGIRVLLVDERWQLVPAGVPGELCLAGDELPRGLAGSAALTALRLIPDPWSEAPGGRLLRSGWTARFRSDGRLELLGARQPAVRVRGSRVDPGEIESLLRRHPDVRDAAVTARRTGSAEVRLVAYTAVRRPGASRELPGFLRDLLPHRMVPSVWVELDSLPRTAAGRIDSASLPEPAESGAVAEEALSPVEEILLRLCMEVLNVERFGRFDNLFDLGFQSLVATLLVSRVRGSFGVDIPLARLFERPTLAGLAAQVERALRTAEGLEAPPIVPVPRDRDLPLSFAQERLWFMDRLEPRSAAYNILRALRATGPLDAAVIESAFSELVRRHETLRTCFPLGEAGLACQSILPAQLLRLPVCDLDGLPVEEREREAWKILRDEHRCGFDLAKGPLLRVRLLRLAAHDHVVLLNIHHIVSDGWSMEILVREVRILYEALSAGRPSPLPGLPVQYADFAFWQRQWLREEVLETQLAYWRRVLAGAPDTLHLPTDRSRTAAPTFRGADFDFRLPADLSRWIRETCFSFGATPFMGLLAVFQILLQRHSGREDIVVGTDVANRNRAEIEGLIGFFINHLVLRTDLSGNPSFSEVLKRVREVTLGAYTHQDLPFDVLVKALNVPRKVGRTPLFQVLFVLQNAPRPALRMPGLTLAPLDLQSGGSKFDLALFMAETPEGTVGRFTYSTELFEEGTVARMARHFEQLLRSLAERPDAPISTLEMLTDAEREERLARARDRRESRGLGLRKAAERVRDLSRVSLVRAAPLAEDATLPWLIEANVADFDTLGWAASHRGEVEAALLERGAVLFRGFGIASPGELEAFIEAVAPGARRDVADTLREERETSPLSEGFHPQDETVAFHHGGTVAGEWPLKSWLFCEKPAPTGGETPLVDSRVVLSRLAPDVAAELERRELMFVTDLDDNPATGWPALFGTEDRDEVAERIRAAAGEVEWQNGGLRILRRRRAVTRHPKTGEAVLCLDRVRLAARPGQGVTRAICFGDGTPVPERIGEEIERTSWSHCTIVPWRTGDILMIDNFLVARARSLFSGLRRILIASGDPVRV